MAEKVCEALWDYESLHAGELALEAGKHYAIVYQVRLQRFGGDDVSFGGAALHCCELSLLHFNEYFFFFARRSLVSVPHW